MQVHPLSKYRRNVTTVQLVSYSHSPVHLLAFLIYSAAESSIDEASLSDSSPTRKKRKRNRFLDGLRKKVTTEIGEVDRFFNDTVPGSLKDLDRFPTIKQIFM